LRNAGFEPGVKVRVALTLYSNMRFKNEAEMQNNDYYSKDVYVVLAHHGYGLLLKGGQPKDENIKVMGRNLKLA